jgi:FMN phosphatase YigB (HAD superfamily)
MIRTVIFDWKRTLYDPDDKVLIPGSRELLDALRSKGMQMALIGKGDEDMHAEVERLGVKEYFSHISFREGVKDDALFSEHMSKDPHETLFIGDRIRSELAVGKRLEAQTMWVRQGKFADEAPESEAQQPDHMVFSLSEAAQLLKTLNVA